MLGSWPANTQHFLQSLPRARHETFSLIFGFWQKFHSRTAFGQKSLIYWWWISTFLQKSRFQVSYWYCIGSQPNQFGKFNGWLYCALLRFGGLVPPLQIQLDRFNLKIMQSNRVIRLQNSEYANWIFWWMASPKHWRHRKNLRTIQRFLFANEISI